jgi:hypothetical protein
METSFYPPRHTFNNNTYDDNLNLQHEALKRTMNSYENVSNLGTDGAEDTPIIEKMPPPIKIKRRTKKDIKDLMA